MSSKVNYINNKELLREIHASKVSYCWYEKPEYANFDVIVRAAAEITPERAIKVAEEKSQGRPRDKTPPVPVAPQDVVFRLMTHAHIPLDPDRKRKARNTDQSYARTIFPPFKHFVIRDGAAVEVCRSHWQGSLSNGHFCQDNGKINNRLATMFMLLVERYARRGNWRGYCVDTETDALTKRGWLKWDEINEDDTILSLKDGQLTWSKIKSIYRGEYDGLMHHLTIKGMDALVTPEHKFVTQDGLKKVELLKETDKVIMMGSFVEGPSEKTYSDAFVELVGWAAAEGCFEQRGGSSRLTIYQNEGPFAERIRSRLDQLGWGYSTHVRKAPRRNVHFLLNVEGTTAIRSVMAEIGNKALSLDFIHALTPAQRVLLIETMIDGDGWRTGGDPRLRRYGQKCEHHVESFVTLCTLAGLRTTTKQRATTSRTSGTTSHYHTVVIFSDRANHSRVENIDFHGGKRNGTVKGRGKEHHPNVPTVPYTGMVWCPETEFGSFVCRRNNNVYVTGNTYNDEMRSFALMQLSYVGLQFDESKGDNPFAFYTTTIKNCFRRIINLERKNQHIRDEMLIMSGVNPSYARQIEHEIESRQQIAAAPIKPAAPGRGRPRA